MEDYPTTIAEFESKFSSEEACRDYLFGLRWPQGFICPRCHATKAWPTKRNLLVCGVCGYQVSMTAGTIFRDTHKPLDMWFRAIWFATNQKIGASALEKDGKRVGRIRLVSVPNASAENLEEAMRCAWRLGNLSRWPG